MLLLLAACGGGGGGGGGGGPQTGADDILYIQEGGVVRLSLQEGWVDDSSLYGAGLGIDNIFITSSTVTNNGQNATVTLNIVDDDGTEHTGTYSVELIGADKDKFRLESVAKDIQKDITADLFIVLKSGVTLDYEDPQDANGDNAYEIGISATTTDTRIPSAFRTDSGVGSIRVTNDPSDDQTGIGGGGGGGGRTSGAFDVGDVIRAGETVQFTGSGIDGTIAYDGSGFSINLMVGNSKISFNRSSAQLGGELSVSGIKFSNTGELTALPAGVTAKFVASGGGANSEGSPPEESLLDFDILGEVPGESMVPEITADIM